MEFALWAAIIGVLLVAMALSDSVLAQTLIALTLAVVVALTALQERARKATARPPSRL